MKKKLFIIFVINIFICQFSFANIQNKIIVKVDPGYFRPTDIDELRGDSKKARRELKWKPKTNFKSLVEEMVIKDIERNPN